MMLLLPERTLSSIDTVHHCDALTLLNAMPSASVDLIATDPPYMGVKDEAWDNQWATDADYLRWIGDLCQQWRRILKPNGSLYVFASPRMAARVEVKIGEYFNVLNSARWLKEAGWHNKTEKEMIRGYLSNWETVVFAEQFASDGKYASLEYELNGYVFRPLKEWFRDRAKAHNITLQQLNGALGAATNGGGLASGYFGEKVEFQLPTSERYTQMQVAFPKVFDRAYTDLRREYEDLRRPFNLTAYDQYTDVWRFDTVQPYTGKHPCEKPLALMKHIINVSSRAGGLVLDCFAGSGTTLDAARQLGRRYIGCDMDAHWAAYARRRLSHAYTIPMLLETIERGA